MVRRNARTLVALVVVLGLLLSCAPAAQRPASPSATAPGDAAATAKPAAAVPAATARPAATPVKAAPTLPPGADPQIFGGTPIYGGILTVAMRDNPPTFDVHQGQAMSIMSTVSSSYNTLLTWDHVDHKRMIPDLARGWEVSQDGRTYTFYLEEGVKWHDGTPFTAEDVKYSLMREKDPPKGIYIFARGMFEPMESVEAVDRYTVKVRMSRATASFPVVMTLAVNSILPRHILEKRPDMKFDILGTGPWKLKNFASGVSLELVKNADYFKKGLPYMDGRIAYIIVDPSSRLAAFRTGRVLTDNQDHEPPAIDTIEQTMKDVVNAYRLPGLLSTSNPFIVQNKPPFSDVRVRRALNLALDRWEFVRVISPGFYGIGGYMAPGGLWAIAEEELLKQPGYARTGPAKDAEREQAKRLLAEAGYPNGFDFELETRTQTEYVNIAVWMKAQLEKIGLRTNIKPIETAAYFDHLTKQAFQVMSSANGMDADDPDLVFSMAFVKDAGKNFGKYYSAEFDKLFVEQSATIDSATRKEIVRKMQLILHETVPYPVLGWKNRTVGVWKKVKGYTPWTNNSRFSAVGRHENTWLDPKLPPF
ncbi:MAG: ABC transporter substrate-binding protein [Chloroflexi bacterium]|nr:ABC transporter substrate-binding protein [Chloroflexota bacterium]